MHPWCWLKDNSAVLQALGSLASLPLLLYAGLFAKRAAAAAEDQARAAKAQVVSSDAASRLAEQQLLAARDAAGAEREHTTLLQQQLLADLRPVLVFLIEPTGFGTQLVLQNQSQAGVASRISVRYKAHSDSRSHSKRHPVSVSLLGPGMKSQVLDISSVEQLKDGEVQATYWSADDRKFITAGICDGAARMMQNTWELDDETFHQSKETLVGFPAS